MSDHLTSPPEKPPLDRRALALMGCSSPALGELFFRSAANLLAITDCELRKRVVRHVRDDCPVCFSHSLDLLIRDLPSHLLEPQ